LSNSSEVIEHEIGPNAQFLIAENFGYFRVDGLEVSRRYPSPRLEKREVGKKTEKPMTMDCKERLLK
jgi:hypothetical protein